MTSAFLRSQFAGSTGLLASTSSLMVRQVTSALSPQVRQSVTCTLTTLHRILLHNCSQGRPLAGAVRLQHTGNCVA